MNEPTPYRLENKAANTIKTRKHLAKHNIWMNKLNFNTNKKKFANRITNSPRIKRICANNQNIALKCTKMVVKWG